MATRPGRAQSQTLLTARTLNDISKLYMEMVPSAGIEPTTY